MAETGAIPRDSAFFSFLEPARRYVDYYWLFQRLIYRVHAAGGYLGLVVLRTAWLAAIAAAVAGVAFRGRRHDGWSALLVVLFLLPALPRCLMLRPHLAEYFAIAAMLWILDGPPTWAPLLPLLAVGWGNLHGISYPVLLWIGGCYCAERLLRRRGALDDRALAFCAVAMAAVFLTPFGADLLAVPFTPLDRAQHQISEFQLVPWRELLTVGFAAGAPAGTTGFNLLLGLGVLSAITGLSTRSARWSHLGLFAGGLALLSRGNRFYHEAALLALPLLREHPPFAPVEARARWAGRLAAAAALLAPFGALAPWLTARPLYPFSETALPRGVAAFLEREGGGGKLLQHSDVGGYYEWRLTPRYRIAMDMQMPFLFSEDDLFMVNQSFQDPELLGYFMKRYAPEFVAVPAGDRGFRVAAKKFPDLRPVFSDQHDVLYADRRRRPELVRRWEMPVDPFTLGELEASALRGPKEWDGCRPRFLARMLEADPDNLPANLAAGRMCLSKGDAPRAGDHALRLIEVYPEVAAGYRLLGESLEARGDAGGAVRAYRRALDRGENPRFLHQRLSILYEKLGRHRDALREAAEIAPELGPTPPLPPSPQSRPSRT